MNDLESIPDEMIKDILMRSSDAQRLVYHIICRRWQRLTVATFTYERVKLEELACGDPDGSREFMEFIITHVSELISPVKTRHSYNFSFEKAAAYLARAGRLQDLQWAMGNAWPVGHDAMVAAAMMGHLPILDMLSKTRTWFNITHVATAGAIYSRTEVLEWCESRRPDTLQPAFYYLAAENGHFNVISWLDGRVSLHAIDMDILIDCAVIGGNVEICKWLASKGGSITRFRATTAALHGHINILRWLASISSPVAYPFNYPKILDCLLFPGDVYGPRGASRVDILKWVHDEQRQDVSWREDACEIAALASDADLVKQLYHYGCPLTHGVYQTVVCWGNISLFIWLCEQKRPSSESACCMAAIKNNRFDVLRYIHGMSYPCSCSREMINATLGNFDTDA